MALIQHILKVMGTNRADSKDNYKKYLTKGNNKQTPMGSMLND